AARSRRPGRVPGGEERRQHRRPPRSQRRRLVMPADRMGRVRGRMGELGVDVLLLSIGADLPWLTGYEALETERLTMLVLPRGGDATLVVPRLEAARVREESDAFSVAAWDETDDPLAVVGKLAGAP